MDKNNIVTEENLTINDFERVCRTCLSTIDLKPISDVFDLAYFPVEIALNKYTQVQFDPTDNLPKHICSSCVKNLNNSYDFLLNCDLVNTTLKECLSRYERNLLTNIYVPKDIEYVNCQIKQDPAEFNSAEVKPTEQSVVLTHDGIERVDIKEEVPDNSEDENDSDNYEPDEEPIITNVKQTKRETFKRKCEREMQVDTNSDNDDTAELAKTDTNDSLPIKSRERYEIVYRKFMDWRLKNNDESFSESILLTYFQELSNTKKPSSLWATYSILRTTINVNHNIKIAAYPKLIALLKRKSYGFKSKKAKTLNSKEINDFLQNAPDSKYLFMKVVLIIGISGACRKQELRNMKPEHIEDTGKTLIIKIPDSKTHRTFVVSEAFYPTCKKYINLRPSGLLPFFLNYINERCTKQCVGINKFGSITKEIAEYLGLPDANQYTSHCFRRSEATILFDTGKE